jgi:hypothetical protein
MKHKHTMFKNGEPDRRVAEDMMKEIFAETQKRRILIRKASGEVAFEVPIIISIVLLIVGLVFFFPVLLIGLITGYFAKLRIEVIRDMTDDEAHMVTTLDPDNTVHAIQYEAGDGQATVMQ